MDAATVKTIVTFVPALILATLDLWLRNRRVSDPTLLWLYLGLLSWSLASFASTGGAIGLIYDISPSLRAEQISPETIGEFANYIVSPITSVLFTIAAFRLSRVKEVFRGKPSHRIRFVVISLVVTLSAISLSLILNSWDLLPAKYYDGLASVLAVLCLGAGVTFSFWKYNNSPLACLSVATFIAILWRQIDSIWLQTPTDGWRLVTSIASNTSMGALFIALAIAWGLSEASRLTIVGPPNAVSVVALFFDLRGSTKWAQDVASDTQVNDFMNALREWALESAHRHIEFRRRPSMVKFLGDGYMIVWEEEYQPVVLEQAVDAACHLANGYESWKHEILESGKFFRNLPDGLGVGLDFGPALRLTHENGSYDYVGKAINFAAKFQALARPEGGVVISEKRLQQLDSSRQAMFSKSGELQIGQNETLVIVKMTPSPS